MNTLLLSLVLLGLQLGTPKIVKPQAEPKKGCKLTKQAYEECKKASRIPVCVETGPLKGSYHCEKPTKEKRP